MVSKFKTGHYYLVEAGYIIYIVADFTEETYASVKNINNGRQTNINKAWLNKHIIKDLGTNHSAVQVLLSSTIRGAYV